MKVALDRPGKFSRSKQSRSNVPPKYASARRFFARLASEIFLTSLQTDFFQKPARGDFHGEGKSRNHWLWKYWYGSTL